MFVATGVQASADPNAPHGGAWDFLGAFLVAPLGLASLLAAVAVARRWRGRWVLQAMPFAMAAGVVVLGLVR